MTWATNAIAAIHAELIRSEQAVQNIVKDIVNDAEIGLGALQGAGNWIAAHSGEIATAIETAATFAVAVGAPVSPVLLAEVGAADQALQAFASSHNAGQSTPSSIVSGYVAYKTGMGLASAATAQSIQAKAATVLSGVNAAASAVSAATAPGSTLNTLAGSVAAALANGPAAPAPAVP